jgi:hypothetical protein
MHRTGWGTAARQQMKRRLRASSADLISVAGHSRGLHQTPIEARYDHLSQRERDSDRSGT